MILLRKWLWRFGEEDNHLWMRVIGVKYGEFGGNGLQRMLELLMAVVCGRESDRNVIDLRVILIM